MGFSFSAKKRKEYNRQLEPVQKMIAVAEGYGFNSGSEDDLEVFEWLFARFQRQFGMPDRGPAGAQVAQLTKGSQYPMAADAAWAAASLLPNSVLSDTGKVLGNAGVINAATWFTDEFPGIAKSEVLGKKMTGWRVPAAAAALMLVAHADETGF